MNNDPKPFTVTSQPRKQGNISAFSPFMILVTTFDVALRFRPPMCKKCLEKSPLYIKFNSKKQNLREIAFKKLTIGCFMKNLL